MTTPTPTAEEVELALKLSEARCGWATTMALNRAGKAQKPPHSLELTLAKAALAFIDSQEGWRTMDSAPKDGTYVDLWVPESGQQDGHRLADAYYHRTDGWRSRSHSLINGPQVPTHWQPLPTPPKEGGLTPCR